MRRITGALWDKRGVSRDVFLVGRWAVKLPKLTYGWKMFLCGLLANMQERSFAATKWPQLCPVSFSLPGGWLVVMHRARVMTEEEFSSFDAKAFCDQPDYIVPCEFKSDSFGWLDGRIVVIDYGN